MLTWRGETRAEQGFRDELAARGCAVQYFQWDARQDVKRLCSFLRTEFDTSRFDYVYTFGTTCSLRVQETVRGRIPQIYCIVTYPERVGLAKSLERGGYRNIAGVSQRVSASMQLSFAVRALNCSRLCMLFNPRERNSVTHKDRFCAAAESMGIQVDTYRVAPDSDYLDCFLIDLKTGGTDFDVLYLPADSYLCSRIVDIKESCIAARVPVVGASEQLVRDGALLGMVVDYEYMGRLAARQLLAHEEGVPLEDMPVGRAEEDDIYLGVNKETMRRMELQLPPDMGGVPIRYY